MSPAIAEDNLTESLHETFGFRDFRPLQEDAVRAALAGRDLLVVMPTGAGKSLCFQLPAALAQGTTLVVSPLIALMRDQVDALNRRPAFAALGCACLTSLQTAEDQRNILSEVRSGHIRLMYVAPERFRSGAFLETLRSVRIARLVIDEAHCISEWGHDFRPDYLSLKSVADALGRPPITAVTATATKRVQQSIVTNLGMQDPLTLVGGFNRPNLHFSVVRCKSDRDREERLARAMPKLAALSGSGLIYVATRKQCEEMLEVASGALAAVGKTAGMYHAGLNASLRNSNQERWLSGELHTLVATNAFGMGIDKADVRFVIHCACPDSIESYYQEAGRAGRDGRKSRCVILYHFADRRTREWFIDNEALSPEIIQKVHRQICAESAEDIFRLSKARLARMLGPSDRASALTLRLAVSELERSGMIARMGETQDDISIRLLNREFPANALKRIGTDLGAQRKERYRRLDEIIDYCKTPNCRRRTILDYFGDREEPEQAVFCCDNCEHPQPVRTVSARTNGPAAPPPENVGAGDIYAILQGIDSLRYPLGRSRLNKLLRGSSARGTEQFERHPLFGALKGVARNRAEAFLNQLIEEGLLRQGDEDEYFVCTVTQAGRAAWQERTPLTLSAPRAAGDIRAVEESGTGELYDALRTWRTREASARQLPPYCVFSDKTLCEIASRQPQELEDLSAVPGIGRRKLEQYGHAIMIILRQFAAG